MNTLEVHQIAKEGGARIGEFVHTARGVNRNALTRGTLRVSTNPFLTMRKFYVLTPQAENTRTTFYGYCIATLRAFRNQKQVLEMPFDTGAMKTRFRALGTETFAGERDYAVTFNVTPTIEKNYGNFAGDVPERCREFILFECEASGRQIPIAPVELECECDEVRLDFETQTADRSPKVWANVFFLGVESL